VFADDGSAEGDHLITVNQDGAGNVTNFVVSVDEDGVVTAAEDYGMLILAQDLSIIT